jgi:hypothetical protein
MGVGFTYVGTTTDDLICRTMYDLQLSKDIIVAWTKTKPHDNVKEAADLIVRRYSDSFSEKAGTLRLLYETDAKLSELVDWYKEKHELDLTYYELKNGKVLLESKKITNLLSI